jgi:hypothetical protein
MQGEGSGPIYHRKRCVGHQNGESNWPVAPNSPAPGWCWAHWSRLWVQLLPNYALVRRRHSEDPHEYLPHRVSLHIIHTLVAEELISYARHSFLCSMFNPCSPPAPVHTFGSSAGSRPPVDRQSGTSINTKPGSFPPCHWWTRPPSSRLQQQVHAQNRIRHISTAATILP